MNPILAYDGGMQKSRSACGVWVVAASLASGVLLSTEVGCGSSTHPATWSPIAELPMDDASLGPLRIGMSIAEIEPPLVCADAGLDKWMCSFPMGGRTLQAELHLDPPYESAIHVRGFRVHWYKGTSRRAVCDEALRLLVEFAEHGWISPADRERIAPRIEETATAKPGDARWFGSGESLFIRGRIRFGLDLRMFDQSVTPVREVDELVLDVDEYVPSGPTWASTIVRTRDDGRAPVPR